MNSKSLPFDKGRIDAIVEEYGTPFHLYDEAGLRDNARRFQAAFGKLHGFKEYFAVKALPNPRILEILKEEGFGTDCSSIAELILSEKVGIVGEEIMFTSNNTALSEFAKAKELGAIINLDDIAHIDFVEKGIGLPELICFRYNPGPLREGNAIIGDPKEAKYGFTKEQLFEGYRKCLDLGVKRFGLHAMIISNELNGEYFVDTAIMLFDLVLEIKEKLGIDIEFLDFGGGIGIPYRPEETPVDYEMIAQGILTAYKKVESIAPKLFHECGRVITGPYGYLVSKVRHLKSTYKDYVGLDSCMADLMRPGMYEAYHHITVMGKEEARCDRMYDVVGSLCENNDKFAIDRKLPAIERDDIVVIHDTGAHGHAMGFNYNGKLRSAELLLKTDGSVELIRRAETLDDYFATLKW